MLTCDWSMIRNAFMYLHISWNYKSICQSGVHFCLPIECLIVRAGGWGPTAGRQGLVLAHREGCLMMRNGEWQCTQRYHCGITIPCSISYTALNTHLTLSPFFMYSRLQDDVGVLGSQDPRLLRAISALVAATRPSIPLLSIGSIA